MPREMCGEIAMSGQSEIEELRRIRAQQREEAEAARLQEIEKQKERDKRAAFKAKAASFEQRGPTADDVKASVQKEAASRKFNRLLSKQLASPDSKNPLSTEINLRNQVNHKTPYDYDPNLASSASNQSNWEFVDQGSSGPSYYWNRTTNETTFDRPPELDAQPNAPPPPPPPPPPRRQLPGMEALNPVTEESQNASASPYDDPSNWELVSNQAGGDYYLNVVTNECTYVMPQCIVQLMEEYTQETDVQDPNVPSTPQTPKWEARWDETYQAYYYLNLESGESTWEKPHDLN